MTTRKGTYMHFTSGEKHDTEQDKGVILTQHLNPELHSSATGASNGHHNPIFHRQKPFLAQGKTKATSGFKQAPSNEYYRHAPDDNSGQSDARTKSNSFAIERNEKNKSKYDYLMYAQRQHQLEKQSSKELTSKDTSLAASRVESSTLGEVQILREENQCLHEKIRQLEADIRRGVDSIKEKEKDVADRDQVLEQLMAELQKIKVISMDYRSLETHYNNLLMENHRLKENQGYFEELNTKYIQAVEHCSSLQAILRQKDEFMQQTLARKDQQYQSAVACKNSEIKSLELRVNILERQNQKLVEELERCGDNSDKSSEINRFKEISTDFEAKINEVVEDNGRLKSIIGQKEGIIQQLRMHNTSLEKIIKAFQERDSIQTDSRLIAQIQSLKQQLQKQQEEFDRHRSEYELQILRLENDMAARRYEQSGTLLDFTDRERLLDTFSNLLDEAYKYRGKLHESQ